MSWSIPAGATVLFEGDSITGFRGAPHFDTWAWQRLSHAHYGYPERVGDWLFCQRPELRLSVRNGAIAGSVMAEVLERFERMVAPLTPAVVVLTMGSNDTARGLEPAAVGAAMARFCERLAQLCRGRVLHLGGVHRGYDAAHQERARPVQQALAAAVRAAGGESVDAMQVLDQRQRVLRALYDGHTVYHDGVHVNAVGAEILAGITLRALGLLEVPGAEPLPLV